MANRHRGEISAEIDGQEWTLCLTLGSLAELEASFGASDLSGLLEILGGGHLSALQLTAILAAGLRGGGHEVSLDEAAQMRCDGGLAGLAVIIARLLSATFGNSAKQADLPNPHLPQDA